MVDDDREIRVAFPEADRVEYVPRLDQGVETQAEPDQPSNERIELGTQYPIILGEILQVGPNTLQHGRTGPLFEVSDRVRSQHIDPPDNAADEVVSVAKTQEVAHLLDGGRGRDQYATFDAVRLHQRSGITGTVVSVKNLQFGRHPERVGSLHRQGPEMHVGINATHAYSPSLPP